MNTYAHIVTLTDPLSNGYSPKLVFTFTSRYKAVLKMQELYKKELEKHGLKAEDIQPDDEYIHADFSYPPFLPYAYCHEVYIDYYKTEIL